MEMLFLFLWVALLLPSLWAKATDSVWPDAEVSTKATRFSPKLYIVLMKDEPVIQQQKFVGNGESVNMQADTAVQYANQLHALHQNTLDAVGVSAMAYSYAYTSNGFAAEMSERQAQQLRENPQVLSVTKDQFLKLNTIRTPDFLHLRGAGGAWNQVGGEGEAGEGVIVGVLDTGVWPETDSFLSEGRNYSEIPSRWKGSCVAGERFTLDNCNRKLIGAKYFNAGFGGDEGVKKRFSFEYNSARDAAGHGSHTSSIAAGNSGVVVPGFATPISGMAPRARLAMYKVCWGRGSGGCFTSDILQAIEQAVLDGVDVINYSIGNGASNLYSIIDFAFLQAALAGVFVACAAGNAGPAASSVDNVGPWVTTVAAGTHSTAYEAKAILGDRKSYTGASLSEGTRLAPLILSTAAGLAVANPDQVRLCYPGTLDSTKAIGKIVVCDRGIIDRVDKSAAVKTAGGIGMLLLNTLETESLVSDYHSVPTVHLPASYRDEIRAYAATESATAQLSKFELDTVIAPNVAPFSSRGPDLITGWNLLKPDILAPGVDVLAAYSPDNGGRAFNFLSGTSMASPHIAGIAALLKQAHPDWSRAAIQSAIITSASQTRTDGSDISGGSLAYGGGQVVAPSAMVPGLVYVAGAMDYIAFLCKLGQANPDLCTTVPDRSLSDLNYPSISINAVGSYTVTRTVTSVSAETATYQASISGLKDVGVEVNPVSFTIAPGEKVSYTISFSSAEIRGNSSGAITWSDGIHVVRSPIIWNWFEFMGPAEIFGNVAPLSYTVQTAYRGLLYVRVGGLVAPTITSGVLKMQGETQAVIRVVVEEGTSLARFSLFDGFEYDLNLLVSLNGKSIASSENEFSNEEITLKNPKPGLYEVMVYLVFDEQPITKFNLYQWVVGYCNDTMQVRAPQSTTGGKETISLSFRGLKKNTKYLGSVSYSGLQMPQYEYLTFSSFSETVISIETKNGDEMDGSYVNTDDLMATASSHNLLKMKTAARKEPSVSDNVVSSAATTMISGAILFLLLVCTYVYYRRKVARGTTDEERQPVKQLESYQEML
eukprot:gb/GEZN01000887.1/.p1 GENE.gb/GEZN01000887.1/~~gb/GEZN01000887.1/.p1  ORF type:complete len:1051 (-),score=113.30 gb/GEZN01000887.1/:356-3508(-)